MEDLSRAVADGHRLGLQHGGLTPDILIVAADGRLRISGFGMRALYAKRRQQPDVIVQPGYEAPELMAGASVDGRSDVFSLGAICFELSTGGRAFPGDTNAEIAFRTLGLDVVARAPSGPEVDPELVATIAKALERDRARRLASAAELAAVIARVRARPASETSVPVLAPPMPPPPAPASVPPAASVETKAGGVVHVRRRSGGCDAMCSTPIEFRSYESPSILHLEPVDFDCDRLHHRWPHNQDAAEGSAV